jgi:PAS domain S-box-containing protein
MFNLDLATIRLCALIVVLATLAGLVAFWRFKQLKADAPWWIAGILVYCAAFLPTIVGRTLVYPLLNVLVETGLVLSSLLFFNAVRIKVRKRPLLKFTAIVVAGIALSSYYFNAWDAQPRLRNQLIFLIIALLMYWTAWLMLFPAKKVKQRLFAACGLLIFIYASFNLGNFIYISVADRIQFEFFTLLVLCTAVFIALLTYAFILMAYAELEQTLERAMQRLKKESQSKLQSVKERWVLALECAQSGAWEVDISSDQMLLSEHWAALVGLPIEPIKMATQEVMLFMHPDDIPSFLAAMKKLEKRETTHFEHEHRLRHRNGSWRWVSSRARLFATGDDSSVLKLLGVDIDITEARLRQTELEAAIAASEQAREVAIQASKAKSTFLTNVSHEIRTPMNAIIGFSQLLQQDQSIADTHKESLEIIVSSGQHLLSLIDELLNLSRVQSGHFIVRKEAVNPNELLHEISHYYQKRIVRDGVVFIAEIDQNMPPMLWLDAKAIRQICMNLLTNAFKFTQEGKVILRAAYHKENDEREVLLIEVSDTGIGIKEEHLQLIFQPFEQSTTRSFGEEGFGLGLTICKDIVNQLDGHLDVQSSLEHGSVFRVSVPVTSVSEQQSVSAAKTVQSLTRPETQHTVLIVDDIESNRKLLMRILDNPGFQLLEACDAESALLMIEKSPPDLVLMDIRLPGLSGDAAIVQLRSKTAFAKLPIIAITANAFDGERERLLALGATDFISKPFMRDEVVERVSKALAANEQALNTQTTNKQTTNAVMTNAGHKLEVATPPHTLERGPVVKANFLVLIVDDNAANQQLLTAQLRALGLTADVASNGQEGYECWREHRHDLVLADCAMPVMDGFRMTQLIRQQEHAEPMHKASVIIAVTGSPNEYGERCQEVGMNDMIAKPVLLSLLSRVLRRYFPAVLVR